MIDVFVTRLTEELLRWAYALCLADQRTLVAAGAAIAGIAACAVGMRHLRRGGGLGEHARRRPPLAARRIAGG
jgi:hypothetical protein